METSNISRSGPDGTQSEPPHQTLLKYQAILENASIGIAFTRDRMFEHANPRFEDIFGWEHGTLVGQPGIVVWSSPEQYAHVGRTLGPLLAQGLPVDLDIDLHRRDGTPFTARIRAKPVDPERPLEGGTIWIVEDITAYRQSVEALRRAHDELERRVQARTEELAQANEKLISEIAERESAERRIRHMAHHDALTGLPNRRLLEERLEQALTRAANTGDTLAILFVDLDRFKTINDSLGHAAGDQLLQAVASRLLWSIAATDDAFRVGGDEFVVLLRGAGRREAVTAAAGRLLERLAAPYEVAGQLLRVTPSIGASLYPESGADASTLLARADAAMYHAKLQGRNCFRLFDGSVPQTSNQRLLLEQALHDALKRAELRLHYQPRFDMRTGRLCASEALVRWQHPQRGLLAPAEFIPLAEDCGLIDAVGEWVLHEACRQQARWRERGYPIHPLAVNISAHQFRAAELPELLCRIMNDCRIGPGMLELEITETALMRDTDETQATLELLVSHGARISLDDFGTGYSSLGYLRHFPVHLLKIDRSFVRELETNPSDAAIVRTIVALARNLGMRLVAEGVETPEQLQRLREMGCDEAQGFLLGRPVPAEQFERSWLDEPELALTAGSAAP